MKLKSYPNLVRMSEFSVKDEDLKIKGSDKLPWGDITKDREKIYKNWYKEWAAYEYYYRINNVTKFGNKLLPADRDCYNLVMNIPNFISYCEGVFAE
jgi:hypothetical protein